MNETCCVCGKPIDGEVLVARAEGWEKNWHPVCFARTASAEIARLEGLLRETWAYCSVNVTHWRGPEGKELSYRVRRALGIEREP